MEASAKFTLHLAEQILDYSANKSCAHCSCYFSLRGIEPACTLATTITVAAAWHWLQRTLHVGVKMRHDIWIGLRNVSRQLDQVVKYESGELDDATDNCPLSITHRKRPRLVFAGQLCQNRQRFNYSRRVSSRTAFFERTGGDGMIDYGRLERGASGVDRIAKTESDRG